MPRAEGFVAKVGSASLLLLAALFVAEGASADADERLRAAFLLNVARYVEWPTSAFGSDEGSFAVGVIGDSAFANVLAEHFAGQQVDGRDIVVREVSDANTARDCQLLYGGRDQRSAARSLALELRGEPVLSVAEYDRFAHVGGMVAFEIRRGKIDFEISRSAADRGGLKVSSKLLRLASAVR